MAASPSSPTAKATLLNATYRGIKLSSRIKKPQTGAVSHCSCNYSAFPAQSCFKIRYRKDQCTVTYHAFYCLFATHLLEALFHLMKIDLICLSMICSGEYRRILWWKDVIILIPNSLDCK